MTYDLDSCLRLIDPANKTALMNSEFLSRNPIGELLNDAKELQENMKVFERECFRKFSVDEFLFNKGIFLLGLLKIAVALEIKNEKEEGAERLIAYFTPDERRKLQELEKFDVFDPQVTPASNLAQYIVSESGKIYSLVREAVGKQYVDFSNIMEVWRKELRIRPEIIKAFQVVYQGRFKNIVDSVKLLLDQQPAWLRRLFVEYEEQILASAGVRKKFEDEVKGKLLGEAEVLNRKLLELEADRSRLSSSVQTLESTLYEARMEKDVQSQNLREVSLEYEKLKDSYYGIWGTMDKRLQELNELRKQLDEKEKELQGMAEREKEGSAAKVALQSEVENLRASIGGYENRVSEYEETRTRLNIEMSILQERQFFMDKVLKGEVRGRLVEAVDCKAFERSYLSKFEYNMMELPKTLDTPWGQERVSEWDGRGAAISTEGPEREDLPRNMRMAFRSIKKGFLGLGDEKVITVQAAFKTHLDTLSQKKMDERPLGLGEVLSLIPTPATIGKGSFYVLGVASPTGFEDKTIGYVMGGEEGSSSPFVAKNFGLILVDPLKGEAHWNRQDPRIGSYVRFFVPVTQPELEARVAQSIRDYYSTAWAENPGFPHLNIRKASEVTGSDQEVSLRVIHRLASKGCGSIEKREIGKEGEVAQVFRYLKTKDDPSWRL